ncbi:D-alanine--D-alanine ligase [Marinicellulosiphila megalodicopiae]|uniref:D-alanine--D-alanine ligase n=1 Tax=Marinicellulosiphila megalodicopiae TaxID=2724896 RepID=UPI003BAFF1FF
MNSPFISPGMPPLDQKGKQTSFFEFWPMWLMYLPVFFMWIIWAIRYRSLTLPLIANPKINLSGMVGTPKSDIFNMAGEFAKSSILDWFVVHQSKYSYQQIVTQMQHKGFSFPIVVKPDIGCRGTGVKLIKTEQELKTVLTTYSEDSPIMVQKLSDFEAEVGLFYVKLPGQKTGTIQSMAFKYSPYVVGDGTSTLGELLQKDDRAKDLLDIYQNSCDFDLVLKPEEPHKLVFSASHCRGAIFRDGIEFNTPELEAQLDKIMSDIPDFNYGRLDVKFKDLMSLQKGQTLQIVEINGAASESLHIWDRNANLNQAFCALLWQYKTLFLLGKQAREKGVKTPGIKALIKAWLHERSLVKFYPVND